MRSIILGFILTLVSTLVLGAENFSKVECKLRGRHEIQKKGFLSSKYKTISSNFVEYTPFGAIHFELNAPRDYGFSISGFFGAFSINFDFKRINDEEFEFYVTSRGQEVTTIPLNINDTLIAESDWLRTKEPETFLITGQDGNKRAVLTQVVASCKRIP